MIDLPKLSKSKATKLEAAIGRCFLNLILDLFVRYQHQLNVDLHFVADVCISSVELPYAFKRYRSKAGDELAGSLIDLLLKGVLRK